MSQCPQCGATAEPGNKFCAECGANVLPPGDATVIRPPAAPAPPQGPPAQQPWGQSSPAPAPPQPGQQPWGPPPQQGQQWGPPPQQGQQWAYGTGAAPKVDITRVIGKPASWVGALAVAGSMVGVALVLSLVFGAVAAIEDFAFGDFVWNALFNTSGTFGVDVIADGGDGRGNSYGRMPTLFTLLALGIGGFVFRRSTARTSTYLQAVGEAARVGLLVMLVLLVLAIVVRIVHPAVGGGGDQSLSFAGTIFLGFLLPFSVLVVVAFLRRDWLPGPLQQVHDWLAAPLAGIGVLIALLPVAGLAYLLAAVVGEADFVVPFAEPRELSTVVAQVAALPSLGTWVLGLGLFASAGSWFGGDADERPQTDRLPDVADAMSGLLWIAIPLALVMVGVAVYVTIARTTDKRRALGNVGVLAALSLVLLPFVVRMSNAHFASWDDDDRYTSTLGISGVGTTFMTLLAIVVIGAVLLLATGNLDLSKLQAKMGQHQQQWGQQWGQQYGGQSGAQQQYPGWRWDAQAQQWVPDAASQQPAPPAQPAAPAQAAEPAPQKAEQAAPQTAEMPVAQQYPGWRWDAQAQQWVPDPSTQQPPPQA